MEEKYVINDSYPLHILSQDRQGSPTILMIPGMFGAAEDCLEEFKSLPQYSLRAMSIRGRGKSSSSFSSYSFSSQVSDVIAVIDSYPEEQKIVLFAHSFGCLLAVAACEARRERIAGLILVDKGLIQNQISDEWLQKVIANPPPNSSVEIARRIKDEFAPIDLTETFSSIQKPTLYFKGEQAGHALIDQEAQFLESLNHVQLIRLKNTGHWPSETDYEAFISEIQKFMSKMS